MRYPKNLAATCSRGTSNPRGSRGRGNNVCSFGTWNNCPLRTDSTSLKWFSTNFLTENSSSRKSWSLFKSSNFWILSNTSITKCSFSICHFLCEVELVLVWTVHILFEYAQFPLLENQFVSSIHKIHIFGKIRSVFMFSGSRILLLRTIVPLSFQNDPDLTVF